MPGRSAPRPLPVASPAQEARAAALERDLHRLASDIGERNTRRPKSLHAAGRFIEDELAAVGFTVQRQTYGVDGVECFNIEAEAKGASDRVVVIGAHYDSARGSPGANDNGSGVVALLSLARTFAARSDLRNAIGFVFFTNEEPPHFRTEDMGSRRYADRAAATGDPIVAMISLESLGSYSTEPRSQRYPLGFAFLFPEHGDFLAFVGNHDSRELLRASIGAFRRGSSLPSEGAVLSESTLGVDFSDHASFWRHDVAAIMVTDTALMRDDHYHTADDSVEHVDFDRLARAVEGLERVVEELAAR